MYLDDSVREFKSAVWTKIPRIEIEEQTKLKVLVEYFGNFHNKDGTIKRKDGQNLDKCLYDILFECWGLDDKHVFRGEWTKNQSEKEYTQITVEELKGASK